MRPPRLAGGPLAERGEAVDGRRSLVQPPWSASHSGVVKWWKVTTGSMPALEAAPRTARR